MRALLVYADTSVFGGLFDAEFEKDTRRFFRQVAEGRFRLAVSGQVETEIRPAPDAVKRIYDTYRPHMDFF